MLCLKIAGWVTNHADPDDMQDSEPAPVAQLDVRLIGDQEVAGSTPAEVGSIFCGDWLWNIFYGHSLPSADSRRAVVSFWW